MDRPRRRPGRPRRPAVRAAGPGLPRAWRRLLASETAAPYFQRLCAFLARERSRYPVYPPARDVFAALRLTPPERVHVVILGQDPYPGAGQAHGLAFSVRAGVRPPPSLVNILKELADDVGGPPPAHGYLASWARQGVLLLNTVLTVRGGAPGSHRGRGWELFTDALIDQLNDRAVPLVFALWGRDARRKAARIDARRHVVISGAHPSPLAARAGFLGSRPFSAVNAALRRLGSAEIDWRLADIGDRRQPVNG